MTLRLYRFALSGHAHRAELMLSLLGLPFEKVEVDLAKGEQRQPAFLALNAFAQVPVLVDGDAADATVIADSNAILTYLALRYDASGQWLPREPAAAAQVQRWLSAAAGPLVEGPGMARVEVLFGRPRDPRRHRQAARLFEVMEATLSRSPFLAGPRPTIADLAMYSYTAHAPEGGVTLQPYRAIRAWLESIEALPGFVGMKRLPHAEPLPA